MADPVFEADAARTLYSATVNAVGVSAAQDIFEIVAGTSRRVRIKEVLISQYTDFGDAASEIISVLVVRGYTTTGSGGSTPTPRKLKSWATGQTAIVKANNITVAQDGTPEVLRASAWNIAAEWSYAPPLSEEVWLEINERAVVRITAPADAITLNATIVWEEKDL
jgi:hypothetical protein